MCSVEMFYVLGLVCPVRHLMLDELRHDQKNRAIEAFKKALPSHLKLTISNFSVLDGLFPQEMIPHLTHLVLVFLYHSPPEPSWPPVTQLGRMRRRKRIGTCFRNPDGNVRFTDVY